MRVVRRIAALLVGLVVVVAAVGAMLPVEHVASRSLMLSRPADEVWGVLTDFRGQLAWRKELKAVELVAGAARETWREDTGDGAIAFETSEAIPPTRLVRTIADSTLPFGGRWVYTLEAAGGGTRLTITEEGKIFNVIFRFVSHFFLDQAATIEGVMRGLAMHFGEEPYITP
jgi:Polyketide cyclase / dehydrase and lipid transport